MYGFGAPNTTHMEGAGSISRKQLIGAKRGIKADISQELMGRSPNTPKSHTRKQQRGASWGRRQLPICECEQVYVALRWPDLDLKGFECYLLQKLWLHFAIILDMSRIRILRWTQFSSLGF